MPSPTLPPIQNVLVLKTDLFTAEAIAQVVKRLWPRARCRIAQRVKAARAALRAAPACLLLTGLGMFDGDVCALVKCAARTPRLAKRIVVVTGRRDPRFLALLQELPVDGAYHTQSDGLRHLPRVLRVVQRGGRYFSRKFVQLMCEQDASDDSIFRLLTDAELHALAVFGTGCDAKEAARRLKVSVATARALCRALHGVLRVHHKGDLIRIAHEQGLVRFTPNGVECLDLEELVRRHEAAGRGKHRRQAA